MSSEANKAVVEWFFAEGFNEQRQEKVDAVLALHFVAHHPAFPKGIRSPGGLNHCCEPIGEACQAFCEDHKEVKRDASRDMMRNAHITSPCLD